MRISDWSSDVCSSDLEPPHSVEDLGFARQEMALAEKAREKVAPLNVRNDGRGRRGGLRGGRGNGHDRSPKTEGSGGQAAALRRHPVPFPFTPSPSIFAVPPGLVAMAGVPWGVENI